MSEQQFKVGQQVQIKNNVTRVAALRETHPLKVSGGIGRILATSVAAGDIYYQVWAGNGNGWFDTDELEPVAPPDDELARLRAENTRLQKWLDDIHADDIMVFQHATVYDYNRAGVVAFKVRDFDVDTFKTLADGHTQVIVAVYPIAAAEEAPKPGTDGGA